MYLTIYYQMTNYVEHETVCFMRVGYIVILALEMLIQSLEGDSISINLHYTSCIDESEYMPNIYGRNLCLCEGEYSLTYAEGMCVCVRVEFV